MRAVGPGAGGIGDHVRPFPSRVSTSSHLHTVRYSRAPTIPKVNSPGHDNRLSSLASKQSKCLKLPRVSPSVMCPRGADPTPWLTTASREDCAFLAHPSGWEDNQECQGDRRYQCVWQSRDNRTRGCCSLNRQESHLRRNTGQILLVRCSTEMRP